MFVHRFHRNDDDEVRIVGRNQIIQYEFNIRLDMLDGRCLLNDYAKEIEVFWPQHE